MRRAFEIEHLYGQTDPQTSRRPASSSGRDAYALGSGGAFPRSSRSVFSGCVECSEAPPEGTRADPTIRHQSFWVRHHHPDMAVVEGPHGSSPASRGRFRRCQPVTIGDLRDFLNGGSASLKLPARSPCALEPELRPRERLVLLHVTSFDARCPAKAKEEFWSALGELRTFSVAITKIRSEGLFDTYKLRSDGLRRADQGSLGSY